MDQEKENVNKTMQKGKRGQFNFLKNHIQFHKYFKIIFWGKKMDEKTVNRNRLWENMSFALNSEYI